MRIAILGMAKSGTTALFYKCRAAMPADTVEWFERPLLEPPTAQHVLYKGLLNALKRLDLSHLHRFDRRILITRDPRDRIVSGTLYRVFDCLPFCASDDGVRELLEMLGRKQRDPRAITLREILDRLIAWNGGRPDEFLARAQRTNDYAMATHEAFPDLHALSYEDLVDGNIAGLERHLGLALGSEQATVPPGRSRVVRSRRHGNWRHWLCPSDIDWLRPTFLPFMDRYGYPDDWTLAAEPVITAEHSTEYVRRLVRERRELMQKAGKLPAGLGLDVPPIDSGAAA